MNRLRNIVTGEEFDFRVLLDALSGLSRPRDKITSLLKNKVIVRIKKGLYIFGPEYAKKPFSREILANLIYGPSAVSLDYALHYYGLIPERVETVTSVTTGKKKQFDTPVGRFTYAKIPTPVFSEGLDQIPIDKIRSFLMVCPERALTDRIIMEKSLLKTSSTVMEDYLFDHLRIDKELFFKLSKSKMQKIALKYDDARSSTLFEIFLKRRKMR